MTCPNCGGNIIGDGYNSPRCCENVDVPLDRECDAHILYCDPLIIKPETITRMM